MVVDLKGGTVIIHFPSELMEAVLKAGAKSEVFKERSYRGTDVDSRLIDSGDFAVIKRVVSDTKAFLDSEVARRVVRKLTTVEELSGSDKEKKIGRLETLTEAITVRIAKLPNKWLFQNEGEWFQPFFVESVKFVPSMPYTPQHISIELVAYARGSRDLKVVRVDHEKIKGGITVTDLLQKLELFPETPELRAEHAAYVAKHAEHGKRMGDQYLAKGFGQPVSNRRGAEISFLKDGSMTRVVMDDLYGAEEDRPRRSRDDGSSSPYVSGGFWSPKKNEDELDVETAVLLPLNPVVQVFSLSTHEFAVTHISNLEPYVYDSTMGEKLIMPEKNRRLIDILTSASLKKMDDIVKGKASGIIILCSGPPGVGKSLTAEVYAEVVKRPLYMVQCSQLGTNEEKLEEKLSTVLELAARWRAILLIDEADVYIYERGADITQNAIVGVFLRTLEYFKGIMFMTTNRATVVDDAIISRLTAHVRYDIPAPADAVKIWTVLARQYGVSLDPARAMTAFEGISGRSIRQLIRLSKMMGDHDGKLTITIDMLQKAAEFHDFTEKR